MQLAVAPEAFAVRQPGAVWLAALEELVVALEVLLAVLQGLIAAPEPGVSAAAVKEPVVFVAGQALLVVEGQLVVEWQLVAGRASLVVEGQLAAVE